eukprot:5200878-Pleurochrysis_carterae.AAC.1
MPQTRERTEDPALSQTAAHSPNALANMKRRPWDKQQSTSTHDGVADQHSLKCASSKLKIAKRKK